jgi:hypothetical protein
VLPETSSFGVGSAAGLNVFPPASFASGDTGGWMYLNLNAFTAAFGVAPNVANFALHPGIVRASQNWVVVALSGAGSTAGQFGVDFDATWLGNGCSGQVPTSTLNGGLGTIGPVGGVLVCPAGDPGCTPGVAPFTGTNVTP